VSRCITVILRPDNIMLADGRPVLLDFGSARRIIGDGTQALTTVLKPGYAPIEQYVDDGTMKQGPWTDVYALGGVLYHLATGKPPMQAVSRLLSDPLQSVQALTGDRFSSVFSEAVAKAMAVRVEDRLQNIQQFSEMLGWTIAKPTRVMTLPSASYARAGRPDRADLACGF
jgi:non-specific serine/threonine protein kinase